MSYLRFLIVVIFILGSACKPQATDESGQDALMSDNIMGEVVTTNARSFGYMSSPAILVFSETRDWRHDGGIAAADLAVIEAASDMGYGFFTTEHSGVFNDKDLARFDVIVFNNMTGDALTAAQEAAFTRWLGKGGGTVLIHGAGDNSHQDWAFYHNEILGATFVSHPMAPQFQEASVNVLQPSHPVMAGVPAEFKAVDEWYTFEAPPNANFILLAGLDESSYSPVNTEYGDRSDLRMGPKPADHPIIWARCHGDNQARSVYTAMGHRYDTYAGAEAKLILVNALKWAARKTDPDSKGCSRG